MFYWLRILPDRNTRLEQCFHGSLGVKLTDQHEFGCAPDWLTDLRLDFRSFKDQGAVATEGRSIGNTSLVDPGHLRRRLPPQPVSHPFQPRRKNFGIAM